MAYTTIDDPSAHFQTTLYTGNGSNGNAITNNGNSDLQPDFIIQKRRDAAYANRVWDSNRDPSNYLTTNGLDANAAFTGYLDSFDTDGFTVNYGDNSVNNSGSAFVAWQWKANGGTTSSNTNGTLTSTVQANTDAGFSIVTYTTGSVVAGSSGYFSVGHGLGVTPDVVITKRLSGASNWWTWHQGLTNDTTSYVDLYSTAVEGNVGDMWGNGMTSSVFGGGAGSHFSSSNYIAYCFASKQGYSKIGSYEGMLGATHPIYTGFKPAFVLIKNCSTVDNWILLDNKRDGYNLTEKYLMTSSTSAETTNVDAGDMDFYSNGFRIATSYQSINKIGDKYIYMAFAENPFVTSTGIPTTAR